MAYRKVRDRFIVNRPYPLLKSIEIDVFSDLTVTGVNIVFFYVLNNEIYFKKYFPDVFNSGTSYLHFTYFLGLHAPKQFLFVHQLF